MAKQRAIDRFREFLEYKRISLRKAEIAMEQSNGSLGKYVHDENRDLTNKYITIILNHYTELSRDWLEHGKGEMLKSGSTSPTDIEEKHYVTLPLIPLRAVAGYLSGFDNDGVRIEDCEQYTIPTFYRKGADFLIEVAGDSMMPKFQNGDIVACRKITDASFIQWGYTYVIDTTGGVIMKELNRCEGDDSQFICHSLNPQYADFELPRKSVRCLAMIVGVISSLA